MSTKPQHYTTTAVELDDSETLYVTSRPIYGRQVGYAFSTGFRIVAVPAEHVEYAQRMDATPIDVVDDEWEQARLDESEFADGYAELIAEGALTLRDAVCNACNLRHVTVQLSDS